MNNVLLRFFFFFLKIKSLQEVWGLFIGWDINRKYTSELEERAQETAITLLCCDKMYLLESTKTSLAVNGFVHCQHKR